MLDFWGAQILFELCCNDDAHDVEGRCSDSVGGHSEEENNKGRGVEGRGKEVGSSHHMVAVNVSPITQSHCLLIPEPRKCLPQVWQVAMSMTCDLALSPGIDRGQHKIVPATGCHEQQ